jgi:hypothetical protein
MWDFNKLQGVLNIGHLAADAFGMFNPKAKPAAESKKERFGLFGHDDEIRLQDLFNGLANDEDRDLMGDFFNWAFRINERLGVEQFIKRYLYLNSFLVFLAKAHEKSKSEPKKAGEHKTVAVEKKDGVTTTSTKTWDFYVGDSEEKGNKDKKKEETVAQIHFTDIITRLRAGLSAGKKREVVFEEVYRYLRNRDIPITRVDEKGDVTEWLRRMYGNDKTGALSYYTELKKYVVENAPPLLAATDKQAAAALTKVINEADRRQHVEHGPFARFIRWLGGIGI